VASNDQLIESDQRARSTALDVTRSYIVQAPAGSGKTELLIQRYLKLLAIVNNPEEVVAITFTRKAAAEMRFRVLVALKHAQDEVRPDKTHECLTIDVAQAVLNRDRELGWKLTEFPRRMRIQTLDGLSAGIARSMPLSSTLGGVPIILADTEMQAIYRTAAAATFDWLPTSNPMRTAVERVLVHLDNNAGVYIEYVAQMLESRDQWLTFVASGASGKENTEVVREKLEQRIANLIKERLRWVRKLIPTGLIGQLLKLTAYAAENMRKSDPHHPLTAIGALLELPGIAPTSTKAWRSIVDLLLTKTGTWRKTVNKNDGFPPQDNGERKEFIALLKKISDHEELRRKLQGVRVLPPHQYSNEQWQVLLALFKLLPLAVTELRRLFSERGVADHIEVALAASLALGYADDPGDMALLLDYQIRHLLVDEMQDTSISQYHFLQKLVAGWEEGDGRTLFCVGDPMQSIYRFRNAEVGQFLVARKRGIGALALESLLLRQNFRSGENLVHWFNETFRHTLPVKDDVSVGAIAYVDAVSVDEQCGEGLCRIHPVFGSSPHLEGELGVTIIQDCLKDGTNESIAVLVRSRTHLPLLLAGLREANIKYQAVEIDRLTDLPEIIDILALTRAICHQGDRIAWLALLRGPWVGLTWQDMHRMVKNDSHSIVWGLLRDENLISQLDPSTALRVRGFVRTMQHHLSTNITKSLRERVELAWYALGGPVFLHNAEEVENIYRYLNVLDKIESAGTLTDVAKLESLLDYERVSNTTSNDCRLQIMTMHRAKGLQFDHVLLYGLGRTVGNRQKGMLNWLNVPNNHGTSDMIISPVGPRSELEHDPLHRFIEVSESDKDQLEKDRLLYVACTRAKQSLHLIGHVLLNDDGQSFRMAQSGSLLHRIWPSVTSTFDNAFKVRQPSVTVRNESKLVKPPFRRFTKQWKVPDAAQLPLSVPISVTADRSTEFEVEYYWVSSSARYVGTIVHRWLHKAAEGSVKLQVEALPMLWPATERWCEKLGISADEISDICDRVEMALYGILNDSKGQWSLYGEGHTELAVTGLWNDKVESVIIDRVRVDEAGVHWIIDYKISAHEGGDLEGFLNQESQRYRAQLEKYAGLYRCLTDAPVRVALYFPLLQQFREVLID
jgi:ATP-dependent helicase/nuclease subunit A